MKKVLIGAVVVVVAGLVVFIAGWVLWAIFGGVPKHMDTSFATKASVRHYYNGKHIDSAVTDPKDLAALKAILDGYAYGNDEMDHPACMFSPDVSIKLSDGRKSIKYCPAFCKDGLIQINESGKYLHMSDRNLRAMEKICKKYGLDFSDL